MAGDGTRSVLTGTGSNYGPAAAHAASIALPVLFFFIGAWIYGLPVSSFIGSIALAFGCWGVALYARSVVLKRVPPDTYSAFQYKQSVVFAVSVVGITVVLGATVILSILTIIFRPIAIGYTLYGAYQVGRGRDFRYAIIGKRLSA